MENCRKSSCGLSMCHSLSSLCSNSSTSAMQRLQFCVTNTLQYQYLAIPCSQSTVSNISPAIHSSHCIIAFNNYLAIRCLQCIFIACDPQGNTHSWILVCGDISITAIQSQGLRCITLHRFSFISMIGKAVYAMGTVHLCILVCLCCISTW